MKLLEIVKYNFGFTNKEAKNYIKSIDEKTKEALIAGYNQETKKAFYED